MIRCRILRFTVSSCAAFLLALQPTLVKAEGAAASEHAVKAALIFKLAKFVSWPDSAYSGLSEPLSVCVQKSDPIVAALSTLSGKPIHGRAFSVRYFDNSPFISTDCQILFVSNVSSERPTALLNEISNQPVLTIIDNVNSAHQDGIIGLKIKQNRVQFEINIAASETAGLDISAQLLQLAKITDNRQGT